MKNALYPMADEEIINEIIEEMGKSISTIGLPPVTAKAWATLYFKGEMTQEQLKEELNCSLSMISQSLNLLEKLGLVNTYNKQGRKNIYCAETSFDKIKRKKMELILVYCIEPLVNIMNSRIDQINNKETKTKVKEIKDAYSRMGAMIKLFLKSQPAK